MKKTIILLSAFACVTLQAGEVRTRVYNAAPKTPGEVAVRQTVIDEPEFVGVSPAAFSIVPPLSWPAPEMDVRFFRFNLFLGKHRKATGFDLGLLGNMTAAGANSFALAGLFNAVGYSDGACHLAGLFNYSDWRFSGLQLAAGMSWCEGDMHGLQLAVVNSSGRLTGLQLGAVNVAEQGCGVQIGAVNCSDRFAGLQLGIINMNLGSSAPVLPILNFAF